MGKKILIFLWGALEASMIFLVFLATPDWIKYPVILLVLSSIGLLGAGTVFIVEHWNDE